MIGPLRPNYTGVSVYDAPPGFFLNPAAYATPLPGEWGNAGRDSITESRAVYLERLGWTHVPIEQTG